MPDSPSARRSIVQQGSWNRNLTTTKGRQVINGLRLTSIGFAVFLLLFALLDGFGRAAPNVSLLHVSSGAFAGLAELFVAGAILFVTTKVWAKWVAPVAILGALKSLIGFIAGTTVALPFKSVPRVVAGETLLYFVVVGLLSMRFSTHVPRVIERIALVIAVFAACADMLFEPQLLVLVLGAGSLVVARAVSALAVKSRNRDDHIASES